MKNYRNHLRAAAFMLGYSSMIYAGMKHDLIYFIIFVIIFNLVGFGEPKIG